MSYPAPEALVRKQIERDERTIRRCKALLRRFNITEEHPDPVAIARDHVQRGKGPITYPLSEKAMAKQQRRDLRTIEDTAELLERIDGYPRGNFYILDGTLKVIEAQKKRLGLDRPDGP